MMLNESSRKRTNSSWLWRGILRTLRSGKILTVRYEDMLENLETETRSLDLPFQEPCL